MDARHLAAERGLVARAVAALTTGALGGVAFESLAPTKALLKRFFSAQDWDDSAAETLAVTVGPGEGWWQERLDEDLVLEFGWIDGRFRLRVEGPGEAGATGDVGEADALAATFEGDIVPEATPNPHTLAFRTGPISDVDSREYRSAEEADDARVARLFTAFPELASVLVARDFVALTVRHPDRWPGLLAAVLSLVAEEFAGAGDRAAGDPVGPGMAAVHRTSSAAGRTRPSETRLARAWDELGGLRAAEPAGLERLLAASAAPASVYRQVAAGLLGEGPPDVAGRAWARLVGDPSRTVRRAAVDAVVDAGQEELRPLLEGALADADAWVRWKALRGLAELGAAPSGPVIQPLTDDPDFRVRLEARSALRH
ncbi:MAG: HEAT repeat domain-containing protein [Acidimicrobiales bacterium]